MPVGDSLGASMGATTPQDLDAIDAMSTGVAPDDVDDPASRDAGE